MNIRERERVWHLEDSWIDQETQISTRGLGIREEDNVYVVE
jgi:hypothetical protein